MRQMTHVEAVPRDTSKFLTISSMPDAKVSRTVNGLPAYEIPGGCFLVPDMLPPAESTLTWETMYKVRLEDEISTWMTTSWANIDLKMVQDKTGKLQPCIVLICWDQAKCASDRGRVSTRKALQKRMQRQESLKSCPFPCIVVVDKIQLLAFENLHGSVVYAWLPANRIDDADPGSGADTTIRPPDRLNTVFTTYSGIKIALDGNGTRHCTLGGLIWIDGKAYALTVAHPFYEMQMLEDSAATLDSRFETLSEAEDSDSDDDILFENSVPESLVCSSIGSNFVAAQLSLAQTEPVHEPPMAKSLERKLIGTIHFGFPITDTASTVNARDWLCIALTEGLAILPNTYIDPLTSSRIALRRLGQVDVQRYENAWVLTSENTPSLITVSAKTSQLFMLGLLVQVTQIRLNKPLSKSHQCTFVVCADLHRKG
jgi:hypothetical protein